MLTTFARISIRPGLAIVLALAGTAGCSRHAESREPVSVANEASSVDVDSGNINAPSDFAGPLEPYGTWEDIPGDGLCWCPGDVSPDWRPYADGYWAMSDLGWYWVSPEPWAWATYHYGRWGRDPQRGWYWVPGVQWAPAWVAWREGAGYAGWAPLAPRGRPSPVAAEFVYVDERHFSDRLRPATLIVNRPAIASRTAPIAEARRSPGGAIGAGPSWQTIERATGRIMQPVSARQFRATERAKSVAHTGNPILPGERYALNEQTGTPTEPRGSLTHGSTDSPVRTEPPRPAAVGPRSTESQRAETDLRIPVNRNDRPVSREAPPQTRGDRDHRD